MTVSDILSVIAIIISGYSLYKTNKVSKDIANKTLAKEFFEKFFFTFMVEDFPKKIIEPIEMRNGKIAVSGTDEIETVILETLKKVKPYKYFNADFYMDFYTVMGEVEEHIFQLIEFNSNARLTDEVYESIMTKIDKLSERLYDIMKQEYMC